jgi:hypothetical protein
VLVTAKWAMSIDIIHVMREKLIVFALGKKVTAINAAVSDRFPYALAICRGPLVTSIIQAYL